MKGNNIMKNAGKATLPKGEKLSDKLEKNKALEYISLKNDLTVNEKEKIIDFITNDFKENHPHLEAMGSITKVIAEVFESVDMLTDAIPTLVCYLELAEASEGTRMIIAEMLERCPESSDLLKNALQEIYNATEGYEAAVQTVLFNTTGEGLVKVIGSQLDTVWENTISLVPYVNAFMAGGKIGEKIGSGISNSLFSTEKFLNMLSFPF